MVRVNNMGAIFMTDNVTATSCTKHVDLRYKNVNKYVEDGIVNIVFDMSVANDSGILMKTLGGELHEEHPNKLIGEKPTCFSIIGNILR